MSPPLLASWLAISDVSSGMPALSSTTTAGVSSTVYGRGTVGTSVIIWSMGVSQKFKL